jgi:hypothetical protein
MRRVLLLPVMVVGCASFVWRGEHYIAEYFSPFTLADYERERRIAADGANPMAPSARKLIAGVDRDGATTGRAVVLRCVRSSVALDFSTAVLAPGLHAERGNVLRIEVDDGGRAVATANLTGAEFPSGLIHWHDGMADPRPESSRYTRWRSDRWIVRCRPTG